MFNVLRTNKAVGVQKFCIYQQ